MSTIQHLINGDLVSGGERFADVFNPSTGAAIHKVPLASRETVQQAIDAAKASGLSQGLIVAELHGHAHAQIHQMVTI